MKNEQLPRCNALDDNGKRCLKRSGITVDYHGSSELYKSYRDSREVHWVRINLCIDHAIGVGYDFLGKSPQQKK